MESKENTFTLPEPAGEQPFMHVSALEAGIIHLPGPAFMKEAPTDEWNICPSLSFSLRHSVTGEHLVFDLGIRRDFTTYPPAVQEHIEKRRVVKVPQTADESLAKGGINPKQVKTVMMSHLHFDQ